MLNNKEKCCPRDLQEKKKKIRHSVSMAGKAEGMSYLFIYPM